MQISITTVATTSLTRREPDDSGSDSWGTDEIEGVGVTIGEVIGGSVP
jgi:hypothetical protein